MADSTVKTVDPDQTTAVPSTSVVMGRSMPVMLVSLFLFIAIMAWSSRGMGKRYASAYGKEKMAMGAFAVWSIETLFNGMTGGALGLVYDVVHKAPGEIVS